MPLLRADAEGHARPAPGRGTRRGSTREKLDRITMLATHDHFLNLLQEEAKDLEDPLLIFLYDMVIYRTKVGPH